MRSTRLLTMEQNDETQEKLLPSVAAGRIAYPCTSCFLVFFCHVFANNHSHTRALLTVIRVNKYALCNCFPVFPVTFAADARACVYEMAMKWRDDGTRAWHLAKTWRTTVTRARYTSHATDIKPGTWPQSVKTQLVCIEDLLMARFTKTTPKSTTNDVLCMPALLIAVKELHKPRNTCILSCKNLSALSRI